MLVRERIYEAVLQAARPLLGVAAPLQPRLAQAVAGRREGLARLEAWAAEHRDAARPLVWVHAPSVGEALMAQAIIGALREAVPESQVVFTHFSPSAERMAGRVGADVHGYLPWDLTAPVRVALSALRPGVIAFVRTEVWPTLAREAAGRGSRLALVNAILPEGSSRLGAAARFMLGPTYRRLDAVGAVAAPDAQRFARFGVMRDRVQVTGDARFDQVWGRIHSPERQRAPALRALLDRLRDPEVTTLVAGSTWPPDEAELVPAFARLRMTATVRMIIAPHEPTDAHLQGLERTLDAAGLRHARLAALEARPGMRPEVVVIDRVGILADLYSIADAAYVGGGFHAAGLHSVVEPAGFGVPVLFGPRHGNAREAAELVRAGGGFVGRGAIELETRLLRLVRDAAARAAAGTAARAYVQANLGGAARNAALLARLLRPAS